VVTFANEASVGIATASNGSTIFSGDLLKTGEAGRLQIQSGTMQFVSTPGPPLASSNWRSRVGRTGARFAGVFRKGCF